MNLLIDLLKKTKLRKPVGNEPKYYPNAGPARREGQASMEAVVSFGSQEANNILPGSATNPVVAQILYLSAENDNRLLAENNDNIILE